MTDELERDVIRAIQHEMRTRGHPTPDRHRNEWIDGPNTTGLYIGLIIFVVVICWLAATYLPWSW